MNKIEVFKERLSKIGIEIEYEVYYPFICLVKINNEAVPRFFRSNRGFAIAYHPIGSDVIIYFLDLSKTFELIREVVNTKK